jgi:hypothetical protein
MQAEGGRGLQAGIHVGRKADLWVVREEDADRKACRHRGRWEEGGRRHEQAGSSKMGRDGSRRAETRRQLSQQRR